jgi:CBS domain-containing protein
VFISEISLASKALSVMNEKKITQLLVCSEKDFNTNKKGRKLKGIIEVHALLQYGIK